MAVVDFFPETGANGDTIGATSAGLSNVSPFSGGTGVISTEQAYNGTRSFKFTANSTSGAAYVYQNLAGNTNIAIRFAIYITANPSASISFIRYTVGAAGPVQIQVTSAGLVRIMKDDFTAAWTSSSSVPLNTWLWFSVYAVQGDAGSGQAAVQVIRLSDDTVVMNSGTVSGIGTGTAPYDGFRIGSKASTGTQTWGAVYFDYGRYDDAATGLLLPVQDSGPTLSVSRPAGNIVDLRNSTAGTGTLSYPTPVRVSGPVLTVTSLAAGLWLFGQDDTLTSVYTVSCQQTGGLSDSTNLTISTASSGAIHANAPYVPSGANPGTTWA